MQWETGGAGTPPLIPSSSINKRARPRQSTINSDGFKGGEERRGGTPSNTSMCEHVGVHGVCLSDSVSQDVY